MVNLRSSLSQLRRNIVSPASTSRWPSLKTSRWHDGPPPPGLHTYRIDLHGGQRRVHLRVDPDGSGVLFRDVTDVIHLNATASEIAYQALEGREPGAGAPPDAAQLRQQRQPGRSWTPIWPTSTGWWPR